MITNFQGKKIKKKASCKCLSIIMLDFAIKAKKKYYLQILLEECKYEPEKIKMENLIDGDSEKDSSDKSDSESDTVKIMMNVTNNFLKAKKYFNNNKNLIVCVNHALLDFYLCQYLYLNHSIHY